MVTFLAMTLSSQLLGDPQFGFARHLFQKGEYYRSIGEFQRWLYRHPDDPQAAFAQFFIGRAYQEGDRHKEAIPFFQAAQPIGYLASMRLAESTVKAGLPSEDALFKLALSSRSDVATVHNLLWVYRDVRAGKIEEACKPLTLEPLGSPIQTQLPRSPWGAAFLSALVPGLGQLYDGRRGDALFNVLTVPTLALSSWTAYRNNPPLGVAIGAMAAWLYAGNVYGAADAARQVNKKETERILTEIDRRFDALCQDP